jgi:hypothetical protein
MNELELRRLEEIKASLPPADRELLEKQRQELLRASRKSMVGAIMARNFSHNLGPNVKPQG